MGQAQSQAECYPVALSGGGKLQDSLRKEIKSRHYLKNKSMKLSESDLAALKGKPCAFCGAAQSTSPYKRLARLKAGAYSKANVAPSCTKCFDMRHGASVNQFKAMARRIAAYQSGKKSLPQKPRIAGGAGGGKTSCAVFQHRSRKRCPGCPVMSCETYNDMTSKPCFYCGDRSDARGLDRKNNSPCYTRQSVVPCCKSCNVMKRDYSAAQFVSHMKRVAKK